MMRSRRLAPVALAWLAGSAAAHNRAWPAELECRGPLARVVVDCGGAGRATIEGELVAGESRRLTVFLPARSEHERGSPRLDVDASGDPLERGSVRFVRWLERDPGTTSLPPALRARTRPPVEESAATARPLAIAAVVVASALALALASRRRPAAALAAGIAGGALAAFAGARADPPSPLRVEVEDALVGARERRSVVAAAGAIELPFGQPFELFVEPRDVPLHLVHDFARPRVLAEAPGRTLWVERAFEGDAPAERANPFGDLEQSWWREDGSWTFRGAWSASASLPAARSGPPAPGWLASSLPQGPSVLVGRRRSATGPGAAAFVRVVGR